MASDDLSSCIEHTLLRPEATRAELERALSEAMAWECHGLCVNPSWVWWLGRLHTGFPLISVVGFPFGAIPAAVKSIEAMRAIQDGASEIDMVINLGAVKSGDWTTFEIDVRTVRRSDEDVVLKAILETGYLTDEERDRAAEICIDVGFDYLKTSTGYGPRGATVEDVRALAKFGPVKAAGGIRTRAQAEAMLAAGATRLGTSGTEAILKASPS